MNSFISVIITVNLMMTPLPMPTTEVILTNPILTSEVYLTQEDCLVNYEPKAIPLMNDSIEVESQSIIGDGFETHPCPQNYPDCMVVRWEQSDSHGTTMCHFHKIRHKKE